MTEPHKQILQLFNSFETEEFDADQLGRLLVALSHCLGCTITELLGREIPWGVIDRNINKAMLRGVDRVAKHYSQYEE